MSKGRFIKINPSHAIKLGGIMTIHKAIKILEEYDRKIYRNIKYLEKKTPAVLNNKKVKDDIDIATAITLVLFELRKKQ